jgi:hypothetical protein
MRVLFLTLLAASAAMAQLDSGTITITAGRNVQLPADQYHIYIYLNAAQGSSLEDALTLLPGSGITPADLQQGSNGQFWIFELTGPLSELKDKLAPINRIAQAQKDGAVSYSVNTQVSADAAKAVEACPAPTLVSEARAQAQKIAAAAGFGAGSIISLEAGGPSTVPIFYGVIGAALFGVIGFPFPAFLPPPPVPVSSTQNCSVTVQFKLVR